MPYCWKCGAELDEEAKFCSVCGAPAGPPTKPERKERRPTRILGILAIFLIVLLVTAVIVVALAFLPVRTVDVEPCRMSVPHKSGVNTLNLDLTADVAGVYIAFENLTEEWQSPSIILNASATARVGVFGSADFLERYMPVWHNKTEGNVLTVTVRQDADTIYWPWYSLINVTFDIRIDPSMNTSLNVKTSTGRIVLNTQAGVVLNSLSLEATTGGVEANLVEDVVVAGDVSVKTTIGGVKISWDNVIVKNDVQVNAITTTGGVDVDVKQHEKLLGNITLRAEATSGGVDFSIEIRGDVGAKIESRVTLGGIDVARQVRFSGTESRLLSDNYPAGSNFDVTLKTTTGGIDIDAKYTP